MTNRLWRQAVFPAATVLLAACLWSCQSGVEPATGTEIPNELVGTEFIAGKGPAADAEVRFIPTGYLPGSGGVENTRLPSYSVKTDASGNFRLKGALAGQYNILAVKDGLKSIRDSVAITEIGLDLGTDTLQVPGSIYGTVALQPNHDPRTVTLQMLGTNLFVNVDSTGTFLLQDLAPGRYRLRMETSLDGYTTLFASVSVRTGRIDTLPPLRPYYAFVPIVTGLRATTEFGNISLTWDRTTYHNADSYLIYRDSAGALLPSTFPIARVEKTTYTDTLFSANPKSGQYSLDDTTIREFSYRVRLIDRGGEIGPAYEKTTALAYSVERVTVSGAWRRAIENARFEARSQAAVIEFNDRLWMLGGVGKKGAIFQDVWSSEDGLNWKRELESLNLENTMVYQATVFQSKLWILTQETRPGGRYPVFYSSPDGRTWSKEGSLDAPLADIEYPDGLDEFAGISLTAFQGKLWIFGIPETPPGKGAYSSPDGLTWTSVHMPDAFTGGAVSGVATLYDSLWVMGGHNPADSTDSNSIWRTKDGETWNPWVGTVPSLSNVDGTHFLPRVDMRLIPAGWDVIAIGGRRPLGLAGMNLGFQDLTDQVWSWSGKYWSMIDSHAPFGKRLNPGVAHFKGKIWVIGGISSLTNEVFGDVWTMAHP